MITASCPKCDGEVRLPDSSAGKRVECPDCDHLFTVSAATVPDTEPAARPLTQLELLKSIRLACWTSAGILIGLAALTLLGILVGLLSGGPRGHF